MQSFINNRKDLDSLKGTKDHETFMQFLAETINLWKWSGEKWMLRQDDTTIKQYGFTFADFSNAPIPEQPTNNPDQDAKEQWRQSTSVSRFQAKAALHQAGLLEQVEAFMENPETDVLTKLAWQEASFDRSSTMVSNVATQLNLSETQVDELFEAAMEIRT